MRRALALCVLGLSSPASAYELTGASWRLVSHPDGVPFCPSVDSSKEVQNTPSLRASFASVLDDAAFSWSEDQVPCSALKLKKATCSGAPSYNSNQPWLYWEYNWHQIPGVGSSTLGLTPSWFVDNQLTESKVLFNDRNYVWSVDGSDTDVGTIAVHEFGHFIGMDHYDEYDGNKAQECYAPQYPSVMCSFYVSGVGRALTADDIQGVCYLYPKAGQLGSQCSQNGQCSSSVCLTQEGYCTITCQNEAACPTGYGCTDGRCLRDVPPPTCAVCGDVPCDEDSICMAASGGSFCTSYCQSNSGCPLGFDCVPMQGGGGICWPYSNSCDVDGPGPGQACERGYACGLGNICFEVQNVPTCFGICKTSADCPNGQSCQNTSDSSLKYCDTTQSVCHCDTTWVCDQGCDCDVECQACACDFALSCEPGCACDPHCGAGCRCDATSACDPGCGCDDDCVTTTNPCPCNQTNVCDTNCSCDPQCSGVSEETCDCDKTYSCDAGCACDAECSCESNKTPACDAGSTCDPDCCLCDKTDACDCTCDPDCDSGGCFDWSVTGRAPSRFGGSGLLWLVVPWLLYRARQRQT